MTAIRSGRAMWRRRADPLIAMINVGFLLLIFLLVAGSVARPLDRDLDLVEAARLDPRSPPDAAVILEDGTLRYRGEVVTAEAYAEAVLSAGGTSIRIVPDRNLPARQLVSLAHRIREAGAAEVWVVTRQALE